MGGEAEGDGDGGVMASGAMAGETGLSQPPRIRAKEGQERRIQGRTQAREGSGGLRGGEGAS